MRAWSDGDLVLVDRWNEHGLRRVLVNLSPHAVTLSADTMADLKLVVASVPGFALASSSPSLPARTAALFARHEVTPR